MNRLRIREWKDLDDWRVKYSPLENTEEGTVFQTVFVFFDGVGVLVRRGLIDISIVDELMSRAILSSLHTWFKLL